MVRCTFCGREYEPPFGMTEFDVTGHTRHYCSSKCRKNFKLGRENDRIKWTNVYHEKKKMLADRAISHPQHAAANSSKQQTNKK